MFEIFRKGFDVLLDCMLYSCGEVGTVTEYKIIVGVRILKKTVLARLDSADMTVACSCKKFEFVGVQCGHVIKVLDVRNIQELPGRNFLKRWRIGKV